MSDPVDPVDPAVRARASDELGRAVIGLIRQEPFFGHLLSGINREITNATTSARLTFHKGRPLIRVNPDFFLGASVTDGHRSSIVKHEVLRMLLNHEKRQRPDMDDQIFNLASNVVINQLIGEKWPLPPDAIHLDSFPFDLPPDQTLDWYYRELLEHADEIPQDMDAGHSDRHADGDPGTETDDAIAEHELARAVRDARDRSAADFGDVPAVVQAAIEPLVGVLEPKVDWRRVIRMFTASSRQTRIANTLRRPSKRYGTYPGIRVKRFHRLAVIIDTSGSINPESLAAFFTEVRTIWRQGSSVTIIEADNEVRSSWEYKGQAPGDARGRGGTLFDPALQFVADANPSFDAALYFTDGKAPTPRVRTKCEVLWVLSADADLRSLRGRRTVKLSV